MEIVIQETFECSDSDVQTEARYSTGVGAVISINYFTTIIARSGEKKKQFPKL